MEKTPEIENRKENEINLDNLSFDFCSDEFVEDFYKASVDGGRDFSDTELSELEKIKKCPKLLESSTMLGEIRPYALPFFQKESLNSGRNLVNHGQKNNI